MDYIKRLFKDGTLIFVDKYYHDSVVTIHSHKHFEFVFVENGFSSHVLNGTVSVLTPGDLFGMRPGDMHEYYNVKNASIYNCLFYPEAVLDSMDILSRLPGIGNIVNGDDNLSNLKIHLSGSQASEMKELLRKMSTECRKMETGWKIKLKAHLLEFLVLASRGFENSIMNKNTTGYSSTGRFIRTMEFIESNYADPISVEELAGISGLNVDYFSRLFKKYCGISPLEYIQTYRIAKAIEMFASEAMTVAEISAAVGYEDQNYFSRVFKKITGTTPLTYRNNLAGKNRE